MTYLTIIYRFALGIFLFLVIVGLLCIFLPKYRTLQQLGSERDERAEEIHDLEGRVNTLKHNQRQFRSNPAFVERVAREAGMVKTNEIIFRRED